MTRSASLEMPDGCEYWELRRSTVRRLRAVTEAVFAVRALSCGRLDGRRRATSASVDPGRRAGPSTALEAPVR